MIIVDDDNLGYKILDKKENYTCSHVKMLLFGLMINHIHLYNRDVSEKTITPR
jgi:hypothetical protein